MLKHQTFYKKIVVLSLVIKRAFSMDVGGAHLGITLNQTRCLNGRLCLASQGARGLAHEACFFTYFLRCSGVQQGFLVFEYFVVHCSHIVHNVCVIHDRFNSPRLVTLMQYVDRVYLQGHVVLDGHISLLEISLFLVFFVDISDIVWPMNR